MARAGFGGTPAEAERLYSLGLERAVESILAPKTRSEPPVFEWMENDEIPAMRAELRRLRSELGDSQEVRDQRDVIRKENRSRIFEIRRDWVQRMCESPDPFAEKLTLFWHGHFATSAQKVDEGRLIAMQLEMFRTHGGGDFGTLTKALSRDGAMIRYLDLNQSSDRAPNENFARELLELFTLGEGHYSEEDIREAARAFTGYRFHPIDGSFVFENGRHDAGTKEFFGKSGTFGGDDIIDLVLQKRQCGRFLGARLWEFFAGARPTDAFARMLGDSIRTDDYQIRRFLGRVFRSRVFYSPAVARRLIKSPAQWLAQACRELEIPGPPPRLALQWMSTLGQELLAPPNVRGWEGGASWISASTLVARRNYASMLCGFRSEQSPRELQRLRVPIPESWPEIAQATSTDEKAAALAGRMFGPEAPATARAAATNALDRHGEENEGLRYALRDLMALPEYNLT